MAGAQMQRKLSKPGDGSLYAPKAATLWDREPVWIALYFFFNLALTLYNKIALNTFPFPWSLTCIHSLCAWFGTRQAERRGYFASSGTTLGQKETLTLVAFSTLYTVNIAISNLSLNLVSVPLHQVVRSTTPLFTILISIVAFRKSFLTATYLSLIPVIVGVGLATHGDYSCTTLGFCLTLLSSLLASVKGITTNRILVGKLRFHPLELLMRMSPLAFAQCVIMSVFTGEASTIYTRTVVDGSLPWSTWMSLLLNGGVALGLNIVSFTANKKAGALTMDVCANVKQVLTIVLAVIIFNLQINFVNLMGIALTIFGGAWYSYIEVMSRGKSAPAGGAGTGAGTGPVSTAQSSPSMLNGGFVASAQEEKERLSSGPGLGQSPNPGLRLGGAGSLSRAAPEAAPHSPGGIPLYHRKAPNGSSLTSL